MEKIALINGSPRAPKSNSAKYLEIFKKYYAAEFIEYQVTSRKHKEFCQRLSECDKIVFAFPLYADGIPVTLMDFLKVLESEPLLSLIHIWSRPDIERTDQYVGGKQSLFPSLFSRDKSGSYRCMEEISDIFQGF